eukprot:Protomagalhaensia_sp_Gyna_25__1579@NODE_1811_length_1510_cov_37_296397_g1487_i0_p2_GENE_NODE_1811_length_1510_cov_37_296397_g1487_i0NODE_1811_length_1510_cov_37_296397_g1487_i0_p2_ORF_typecomplete_len192_score6_99Sirohm_synth_C/PF14823_6/0_17_NODE_1811_length_1510_cov_37_296397_g1487_i099674
MTPISCIQSHERQWRLKVLPKMVTIQPIADCHSIECVGTLQAQNNGSVYGLEWIIKAIGTSCQVCIIEGGLTDGPVVLLSSVEEYPEFVLGAPPCINEAATERLLDRPAEELIERFVWDPIMRFDLPTEQELYLRFWIRSIELFILSASRDEMNARTRWITRVSESTSLEQFVANPRGSLRQTVTALFDIF